MRTRRRRSRQRHKRHDYASKGDTVTDKSVAGKNEGFTLVDVKGPPENPAELDLKLAENGQTVAVEEQAVPARGNLLGGFEI